MRKCVISYANLPMRIPVIPSLVAWMACEQFDASRFVKGAVFCLMALVWLAWLLEVTRADQVDVFDATRKRGA